MGQVKWSLQALEDISEIGMFIERNSPHFAEVIVNRLYYSVDRLTEFPRSGREVPELRVGTIRELIVEGYRIVYEIRKDWIEILAVMSGRQDLRRKLAR